MSLKDRLNEYSQSNIYPFHMPGHKRMLENSYKIDMTEVEGVDDLHDPKDVIKAEQIRLAELYKAKESFILVGGSTVGNLSAIYASCEEDDLVLIQRNSHKSVYNGAMLRHLRLGYIYTKCDENGIFRAATLEEIKAAVDKANGEIPKAIVITSPTYEGFVCKIDEIADFCQQQNIILIVDEAHGAHLGFHRELVGQTSSKADITIMSLHKTLPSLTQTAALHVTGDRVDIRRIREALDIFETSSPSYVLMNSVSICLDYLENKENYFNQYVDKLRDFYQIGGQLNKLSIYRINPEERDIGKIIISTKRTNITGVELAKILREKYELETELASFSYVLAMTSIMDSREGFERLKKALLEIDRRLDYGNIEVPTFNDAEGFNNSRKAMEAWQAKAKGAIQLALEEAEGLICQDSVSLYPPGAPVIVPGEIISKEKINLIKKAKSVGIHVTGLNKGLISIVN